MNFKLPHTVSEPAPSSSRTEPNIASPRVKPSPMPMPSAMDRNMLFLEAKASARPRMMQLTTISGINSPRFLCSSGAKPAITRSTIVTNVAMMTIKHGIRTLAGMRFRTDDITTFEQISTNVAASPMPSAFSSDVVTARVGHIPRTNLKMGFSFHSPFISSV